ncbi:Uncharacterized protein SCF082_LOCUS26561 [Durusdinium trenchii]|uniref:DUF4604 domain-containing protein n=1 Tax=Durusdinium trenchii TaxID=1381693 RepID=A0ABP0M8N5_9DINO
MSDDEGPRKGKGKSRGKGKEGGKSGKSGGKASSGGGMSVSRLQVLPKFLQDIHARYRPSDDKRGLKHAEILDKSSPLGRNDDDEYDFEDAQIVDSNLTEEDIKVFQRKRAEKAKPPEAAKEEEGGALRFQKRKGEAKKPDGQSASALKQDGQYGAGLSKKKQRLSFNEDEED